MMDLKKLGKRMVHFWAIVFAFKVFYEFIQVALITGFSSKWQILTLMVAFALVFWAATHMALPMAWLRWWKASRHRFRWFLLGGWAVALAAYILIFQYTHWGIIFSSPWLRGWLWLVLVETGAILLTRDETRWLQFSAFLQMALISGAVFVLARAFSGVTDYPFWLSWSEGNRMWDFSLMFGRHLYNYPPDQPIPAMIDPGRQLLWGAIFLLPHPTIVQVRFWSAVVFTLPLLVFGWALFRRVSHTRLWWLAGIWVFVFLYQGPIYSPLIVSSIFVVLAWKRPLWLALPLVFVAGYFAQMTRWTWMFAPAIWIVMLEFAGVEADETGRLPRQAWIRAAALGGSGLLGGYVVPTLQKMLAATSQALVAPDEIAARATSQPLLWYRLLPNPTYPPGILQGLLLTIAPLVIWLIYLRKTGWNLNGWQRLLLWVAMTAFGVVGLVASTKIGGGSNLHNLDMFLVGMVLLAAVAWKAKGETLLRNLEGQAGWLQALMLILVLLPMWRAPLSMYPLRYDKASVLPYYPDGAVLPPSLPPKDNEKLALQIINDALQHVDGDVLFMDQRQLLTFGYVPAVPLIPEYEKKRMMDEAMGNDADYFASYYRDLENRRFALIITEPLEVRYQPPGEAGFAEENNAWVRWVATPTLCYYEPAITMKKVQVQILVPRPYSICEGGVRRGKDNFAP